MDCGRLMAVDPGGFRLANRPTGVALGLFRGGMGGRVPGLGTDMV